MMSHETRPDSSNIQGVLSSAVDHLQWELQELEYSKGIEVRKGPLSSLEFLREHVSRNKPVVLTDCVREWPCFEKWTEAYLQETLGEKIISVALTPRGRADAIAKAIDPDDSQHQRQIDCFVEPYQSEQSFNTFVQQLKNKASTPVPYLQQQNDSLRSSFPELCTDVELEGPRWAQEAFGCKPDAANLWIGDERSVTTFHKDHYENIYVVVEGSKEFTLLPPCAGHRLYFQSYPHAVYRPDTDGNLTPRLSSPAKFVEWSPVELLPEERRRWPKFYAEESPLPLTCTLHKGQILYLPSLWYHHVSQHNAKSPWVIAVNYWYDMAFDIKYAFHKFVDKLRTVME